MLFYVVAPGLSSANTNASLVKFFFFSFFFFFVCVCVWVYRGRFIYYNMRLVPMARYHMNG